MSKIQSALQMLKTDREAFMAAIVQNFFRWLPDKPYLQLLYRFKMGHRLDLKSPKTFTEKIQWLKLYNRKPEYTLMVDKYAVKKYVADIIGKEYIIPTLGVWDKFDDINFEKLPNQFVLKCTHDSGGLVICKDKKFFDYCFTHIPDFKLEESVIVGDSLSSDILGGKNAGLTTIWYQRDRNITDHGTIHPDYRIFELSELPDLLKKLK